MPFILYINNFSSLHETQLLFKKIVKLESKIEPSLSSIKESNQTVSAMSRILQLFLPHFLSRYRVAAEVFKLSDEGYLKAKKVAVLSHKLIHQQLMMQLHAWWHSVDYFSHIYQSRHITNLRYVMRWRPMRGLVSICQQDKVEQQVLRGLLEPLPIVERRRESVTMDFFIGLPKSEGHGSLWWQIGSQSMLSPQQPSQIVLRRRR